MIDSLLDPRDESARASYGPPLLEYRSGFEDMLNAARARCRGRLPVAWGLDAEGKPAPFWKWHEAGAPLASEFPDFLRDLQADPIARARVRYSPGVTLTDDALRRGFGDEYRPDGPKTELYGQPFTFRDATTRDNWYSPREEAGWQMSPALLPGWRAIWRSFRNQPRMIWLATGDAATSNGTLTLCPPTAHDAALRQLVISKSGRVRLVQPAQAGATTLRMARTVCGWS